MKQELQAFLKKNKLCPVCTAKKLINGTRLNLPAAAPFENGASPTPPMGWASWNLFGRNISETVVTETARAMQTLGLSELGYRYVNVDDCWMSSVRDRAGRLQGDLSAFPSGIPALAEAVNACGFKLGLYASNGTLTCEDMPSSQYHEETDAETLAEWGVEYFKYDFCHNEPIPTAAPGVRGFGLAKAGEAEFAFYGPDRAELRGEAVLLTDPDLSGDGVFIGGLDANAGKAVFYGVSAPEDGEYTLTLRVRKKGGNKTYAEVTVNGKTSYPVYVPGTRGSGAKDGRVQVTVTLEAGENNLLIENPVGSRMDSAAKQYRNMGLLLAAAAEAHAQKEGRPVKPICYSVCEWGLHRPWKWGFTAGNLWRTTPDIRPTWASILGIYEWNVRLYEYASPGHYNDPDMLEVGNGELTVAENAAHFTLWCMMAAPLILGCDLRRFVQPDGGIDRFDPVLRIITNRDAIAIDQDPLCKQCKRVKAGLVDVLAKPLKNNALAVCLLNKTNKPKTVNVSVKELIKDAYVSLPDAPRYSVLDVWEGNTFVTGDAVGDRIPPHGVKLYRIEAAD